MKFYDLTKTGVMPITECRFLIMPINDNMTPEEKQDAYDDAYEWFFKVCEALEDNRRTMFSNVVYVDFN